jgi:hypothetical protein
MQELGNALAGEVQARGDVLRNASGGVKEHADWHKAVWTLRNAKLCGKVCAAHGVAAVGRGALEARRGSAHDAVVQGDMQGREAGAQAISAAGKEAVVSVGKHAGVTHDGVSVNECVPHSQCKDA